MIKHLNKILAVLAMLFAQLAWAQEVEMADTMRSNGLIYVVVAVLAIIFVGLVVYLVSIDKKVSRLERELEERK